jgi:hypothetical protein
MSRRRWIIGAVIGLLVICVVGVLLTPSTEDEEETPAPTEMAASVSTEVPTEAPTVAPTEAPTAEQSAADVGRCEPASPEQIAFIQDGLEDGYLIDQAVVALADPAGVSYFMAARVTNPSAEIKDEIPIWWMNSTYEDPKVPGRAIAVNDAAAVYSTFIDDEASRKRYRATMEDGGAQAVLACSK